MLIDNEVAKRQRIERAIARKLVSEALKAGYALNVNNGGDEDELAAPSVKHSEIMEAMFATDEENVIFFKDGKRVGAVFFVYGNDGYDVINDYSGSLSAFMEPINRYSDSKEPR